MITGPLRAPRWLATTTAGVLLIFGVLPGATQPSLAAAQGPVASGDAAAERRAPKDFDIVGYWVSIVSQNWQFRMVVPGKGEYADIPLNLKAKEFADAWDAAKDEAAGRQCEAYGAAVIMRNPERLHISWQDPNTLEVQTDAGMQTRRLMFGAPRLPANTPASWQGDSTAQWELPPVARGVLGAPPPGPGNAGAMRVITTNLLPGLLRKNGVPYGAQATTKEYWEVNTEPEGGQWLTVTTELDDPEYLQVPFDFTSIFKKERDGSKWDPTPCSLTQ